MYLYFKKINISLFLFCSIVKGVYQEPLGVHYVMFIPTLNSQCTAEQRKKWIPLAESFHMLGTYAQTELGHGQFLSLRQLWEMCKLKLLYSLGSALTVDIVKYDPCRC